LIPDLLKRNLEGTVSYVTEIYFSYVKWWDPKTVEKDSTTPPGPPQQPPKYNQKTYEILQEEMWQEHYRPFTLSSIQKIFSYHMNSTLRNFHPKYDSSKASTNLDTTKIQSSAPSVPNMSLSIQLNIFLVSKRGKKKKAIIDRESPCTDG